MDLSNKPFIGLDMTYAEQRKCRMQDAIDDYLQDDKVTAQLAYDEILECVKDVLDYHKRECVKAQELYDMMLGKL